MGRMLCDTREIRLEVMESKAPSGNVRVRGEFARSDTPTQNGRVYSKSLWEREIGRMRKDLQSRNVLGTADHPESGRTLVTNVSHVVTSLELRDDGIVIGEAEILDTSKGRDILGILRSGVPLGVSSRGFGSTKSVDGHDVVQEDYRLNTFDFVAEPADVHAYPEIVSESVEGPAGEDGLYTKAQLDSRVARAVEEAKLQQEEILRNEFSSKLPILLSKIKEEVRTEIRNDLLKDPSVAASKGALDEVKSVLLPFLTGREAEELLAERDSRIDRLEQKLADRDAKISSLESSEQELARVAKVSGYKYYIEKCLADENPEDVEFIRESLEDVSYFSTLEQLKTKFGEVRDKAVSLREEREERQRQKEAEIREAIEKERAIFAAREAKKDQEIEELRSRHEEYEEKLESLSAQLGGVLDENSQHRVRRYAAKKLTNHPHAAEAQRRLDEANVENEEDVDRIIENLKADKRRNLHSDDAEQVRSRVKRRLGSGREHNINAEERPRKLTEQAGYNETGATLEELMGDSQFR